MSGMIREVADGSPKRDHLLFQSQIPRTTRRAEWCSVQLVFMREGFERYSSIQSHCFGLGDGEAVFVSTGLDAGQNTEADGVG